MAVAQVEAYFPENMRGPEVWKWLDSNPEMRTTLAKQLAPQMHASGNMSNMLQSSQLSPEVCRHLEQCRVCCFRVMPACLHGTALHLNTNEMVVV